MGQKGHKGAMGWPGAIGVPQYVIDIIQFRNEKYFEDIDKCIATRIGTYEDVDRKYDLIDEALNEMVKNTGIA